MIDYETQPIVNQLSLREREVVLLVAQGLKNRQIAEKIAIRECTVKSHLRTIFEKLHVYSRLELALYAVNNGLLVGAISRELSYH
jgi:DNA-binding NarL/FixJ family response regulator